MDVPAIRFTRTSDDVRIAYQVFGSGPPLLWLPVHPFSHLRQNWAVDDLARFWTALAERWTVAMFDIRGTGLSEREAVDWSFEAVMRDMLAVLEALRWPVCDLAMMNSGTPHGLVFAAEYPERVANLLIWEGTACMGTLPMPPDLARIGVENWQLFVDTLVRGLHFMEGDMAEQYISLMLQSVDSEVFLANLPEIFSQDAFPLLHRITAPVLVTAATGQSIYGEAAAQSLAMGLPHVELRLIPRPPYAALSPNLAVASFQHFRFGAAAPDAMPMSDSSRSAYPSAVGMGPTPPTPEATLGPALPHDGLTAREREILVLLAQHLSNKEIAAQLVLSVRTVERHIANIYAKLGIHDRREARAYVEASEGEP